MSAISVVDGVLKIYVDDKWIDVLEHMKGAISKAITLANKEYTKTCFPELNFSITPNDYVKETSTEDSRPENKEENSNKKQQTKVTKQPIVGCSGEHGKPAVQ